MAPEAIDLLIARWVWHFCLTQRRTRATWPARLHDLERSRQTPNVGIASLQTKTQELIF